MSLKSWMHVSVIVDNLYADEEVLNELRYMFKDDTEFIIGKYMPNNEANEDNTDYNSFIGLHENDKHKLMASNFTWQNSSSNSITGRITVYYRKNLHQ